jgi:hypothetical protein
MAQAVAHEFKNLNQDIAYLGNEIFGTVDVAMSEMRDDDPSRQLLSSVQKDIESLHAFSQMSTALALSAYWLTTAAPADIEFKRDANCRDFEAVLWFALRLYKSVRRNWKLQGMSFEQAKEQLCRLYQVENPEDLTKALPIALTLFFVFEPLRNIIAKSPAGQEYPIEITTEVAGNVVFLRQRTVSVEEGQKQRSGSVANLMTILHHASNVCDKFIEIDPTVDVESTRRGDGRFDVCWSTKFTVLGLPGKERDRKRKAEISAS